MEKITMTFNDFMELLQTIDLSNQPPDPEAGDFTEEVEISVE